MKKIKEENKRGLTLLICLGVIILLLVTVIIVDHAKSAKIIKRVEELVNGTEVSAIYLMRDDCKYCTLNKSNMESVVNEYGFEYYNVNTNNLSKSDLNKLLTILNLDGLSTPYLLVVGNGEVKDSLSGIRSYDMLFNFLKTNKLITEDAKLYLNYPTYKEYKKLIKASERQVFVLATSTCQFCLAEHPVLIEIAKETGAKINYLYLDYMFESQEEYDEFMTSLDWFSENTNWGTPTTLIVKESKVKTSLAGYRPIEEVKAFYKENNIIK